MAFKITMAMMATASVGFPAAPATAIRTMIIKFVNWSMSIINAVIFFFSSSSLGPYFLSRFCASWADRPLTDEPSSPTT
jgi:hypothetical protein